MLHTPRPSVAGVCTKGRSGPPTRCGPLFAGQAALVGLLATLGSSSGTVTYQTTSSQLLFLLPFEVAGGRGGLVPNLNNKSDYKACPGLQPQLRHSPPCTTGFLPAQHWRSPVSRPPDRPAVGSIGALRRTRDNNVARHAQYPCETRSSANARHVKIVRATQRRAAQPRENGKATPRHTLFVGANGPQLPPVAAGATGAAAPSQSPPIAAAHRPRHRHLRRPATEDLHLNLPC